MTHDISDVRQHIKAELEQMMQECLPALGGNGSILDEHVNDFFITIENKSGGRLGEGPES